MRDETYFGPGTTPERVARAMEEAQHADKPSRRRPTTSEREAFFAKLAETKKRAEAGG